MTNKEEEKKNYDVIIIGSGPAGLSAGVYAGRYRMKTLILGKLPGGTANEAFEVHNFPSYEAISGAELMQKTVAQVKKIGVEIKNQNVKEIKKKKEGFEIITEKETYPAKKVIFATGLERRKIEIPGEKEFTGKGISSCATCDAGFYKDKTVGVIGGGNSALTSAILLSKYAKKVYLIYRRDKFFRAEPAWIKEVEKTKNIELMFNTVVCRFLGKDKLEEIEFKRNNKQGKMKLDGVFVEIGSTPGTQMAEKLGVKTEKGYIITDKKQKTNVKGIFAAGDVTKNPLKQIIVACGEGAIAAYSAYIEINKDKSKK